jgi:hypothetical protein
MFSPSYLCVLCYLLYWSETGSVLWREDLVSVTFTSKSFWNQDIKQKQDTGSRNIELAASLKEKGAMDMDHPPPQCSKCHHTMP